MDIWPKKIELICISCSTSLFHLVTIGLKELYFKLYPFLFTLVEVVFQKNRATNIKASRSDTL